MKTIQAFQVSDGKVFTSEEDAKKYEKFLEHKDIVEEFLSSSSNRYISIAQKSIARTSIIDWESWKAKNVK